MHFLYFEDIEVGASRTKSIVYDIHKEEIMRFAGWWDPRPFHIDEAAASSSVFGGIVACTAHIFSILSWFGTHGEVRTASLAALGFDELRLHHSVRPGDRLSCTLTCIEKRESRSKPDRGIVRTRLELSNQDNVVTFSVIASTLVAKRSCQLAYG